MKHFVEIIPSMEGVIALLLESYLNQSPAERQTSLEEVFLPIARGADKWKEHADKVQMDKLYDFFEDLSGKDAGDFGGIEPWCDYICETYPDYAEKCQEMFNLFNRR